MDIKRSVTITEDLGNSLRVARKQRHYALTCYAARVVSALPMGEISCAIHNSVKGRLLNTRNMDGELRF